MRGVSDIASLKITGRRGGRERGEGGHDAIKYFYRRSQGSLRASLPAEERFPNYEFKSVGLVCLVLGLFLSFNFHEKSLAPSQK